MSTRPTKDFVHTDIDPGTARRAVRVVAGGSRDTDECARLLEMLGLHEPDLIIESRREERES